MGSFDNLLMPLTRAVFLSDYWQQKPVFLQAPNASRTRFNAFPNLEQFPQLFTGTFSSGRWNGISARPDATILGIDGKPHSIGPVPKEMMEALFNAGSSLCFGPVHARHSELSAFVDSIKTELAIGSDVYMTCYVTPPHSGSTMHYDCQNVFFCQVSGAKHWKYSATPACSYPPMNLDESSLKSVAHIKSSGIEVVPPSNCEMIETTLNVGDVLYLPPGTWHQPHTTDKASLHYTLTFSPFGLQHVLLTMVRYIALSNPKWRKDLRYLSEPQLIDALQQGLDELGNAVRRLDGKALLAKHNQAQSTAARANLFGLFRFM